MSGKEEGHEAEDAIEPVADPQAAFYQQANALAAAQQQASQGWSAAAAQAAARPDALLRKLDDLEKRITALLERLEPLQPLLRLLNEQAKNQTKGT